MRLSLIALLAFSSSAIAAAQSHTSHATHPTLIAQMDLPLPSIGLPLPPIGLPLPQMGLSPERSERLERFERPERPERFERSRSTVLIYWPTFGWPYLPGTALPGTAVPSLPTPRPAQTHASGRLRLELRSGIDPQIYVDGYYVGMLSDVGGELTLDAGGHTIELREEGYENLHVDVRISPDEVVTYRGELKPVSGRGADLPASGADLQGPRADVAPPAPTTIYMIPGCYVGNVPPKDAGLPAGCDQNRAVAFPSRP